MSTIEQKLRLIRDKVREALSREWPGARGEEKFRALFIEAMREQEGTLRANIRTCDLTAEESLRFLLARVGNRDSPLPSSARREWGLHLVLRWLIQAANYGAELEKDGPVGRIYDAAADELLGHLQHHGERPVPIPAPEAIEILNRLEHTVQKTIARKVGFEVERIHGGLRDDGTNSAIDWATREIGASNVTATMRSSWESWDLLALNRLKKKCEPLAEGPFRFMEEHSHGRNDRPLRWESLLEIRNKLAHRHLPFGSTRLAAWISLDYLRHIGFNDLYQQCHDECLEVLDESFDSRSATMKHMSNAIIVVAIVGGVIALSLIWAPALSGSPESASQSPPPSEVADLPTKRTPATTVATSEQSSSSEPAEEDKTPRTPTRRSSAPIGFEDVTQEWVFSDGSIRFDGEATLHWAGCSWQDRISDRNRRTFDGTARQIYERMNGDNVTCYWCSSCWESAPLTGPPAEGD